MLLNLSLLLFNNSRASHKRNTITQTRTSNCHRSSFIGLYCSSLYSRFRSQWKEAAATHTCGAVGKLVMCAATGGEQSSCYKNCVDTMVTVTCDQVMSSGVSSGKDTSSGPVYDDQECCLIGKVYLLCPLARTDFSTPQESFLLWKI